jgi:hypothetical protein
MICKKYNHLLSKLKKILSMKIFIFSLFSFSVSAALTRPARFTEKDIFPLPPGISKFRQESYAHLSKAETLQDLLSVFKQSFGYFISEPLFKYREAIIEKYQKLVSKKDLQEVLEELERADDDKRIYFHCKAMGEYPKAASHMIKYEFDRTDYLWVTKHFGKLISVERARSSGPNEQCIAIIDRLVARAHKYVLGKDIENNFSASI